MGDKAKVSVSLPLSLLLETRRSPRHRQPQQNSGLPARVKRECPFQSRSTSGSGGGRRGEGAIEALLTLSGQAKKFTPGVYECPRKRRLRN